MPYNSVAERFHTKKFCSRLSSREVRFYTENRRFAFLSGLGATYDEHLEHIGKSIVEVLLVLIDFLLGVTAEVLQTNTGLKSVISLQRGPGDPKFQVEGVATTNHSSCHKTRVNGLSCGIRMQAHLSFVQLQITYLTDRQTDRQNSHRHARGKNKRKLMTQITLLSTVKV